MIRIAVCDDEKVYLENIKSLLKLSATEQGMQNDSFRTVVFTPLL